mgnify:FL=1
MANEPGQENSPPKPIRHEDIIVGREPDNHVTRRGIYSGQDDAPYQSSKHYEEKEKNHP